MPRGTLKQSWTLNCAQCEQPFVTLTPGSKFCSSKCRRQKWAPYCRDFKRSEKGRRTEREAYLKRTYGISITIYNEMLAAQNGGCAICGRPNSGVLGHRVLHVDHDKATGHVRGLLCQPCNTGIGSFAHSPELLTQASFYVHSNEEFLNES